MGWYEDTISGLTDRYSGGSGSSSFDWGSLGGDTGSSSGWGSLFKGVSKLFGGGSSGSSGGSSNIWGGILSGLGGAASAFMDEKSVKEAGKQNRQSKAFEASLVDYYNQKDKYRKRIALDSYGQFSTLNRWAPTYAGDRPVDVPPKPSP